MEEKGGVTVAKLRKAPSKVETTGNEPHSTLGDVPQLVISWNFGANSSRQDSSEGAAKQQRPD